MAKAYNPEVRAAVCRAMGVPDPENVTRIVLDIQSGERTRVYVERIGDDDALAADLVPLLMAGTPIGEPGLPECEYGRGRPDHVCEACRPYRTCDRVGGWAPHSSGRACRPGCGEAPVGKPVQTCEQADTCVMSPECPHFGSCSVADGA